MYDSLEPNLVCAPNYRFRTVLTTHLVHLHQRTMTMSFHLVLPIIFGLLLQIFFKSLSVAFCITLLWEKSVFYNSKIHHNSYNSPIPNNQPMAKSKEILFLYPKEPIYNRLQIQSCSSVSKNGPMIVLQWIIVFLSHQMKFATFILLLQRTDIL